MHRSLTHWVLQQKTVIVYNQYDLSINCAAVSVFYAYIYYVVSPSEYEKVTSYVKASALVASLLSGVLGDLVKLVYVFG